MKNVINILLTALLFASVTFKANAQALDMALSSPTVNPSPSVFPGTSTISFSVVAEILDEPLSSDDLGISYATITIGLSNLQGSAAILPTGAGADLFNWVYNAAQNTYIGTSKDATLPADVPLGITLTDLPISAATTANITGFGANLTPPGDLLASESNDDAVSIYTSAPLPVTLVSFTANKESQIVQLAWSTTEETNSDYFEIQRSANAKNWLSLDKVSSNGESKVLRNYSFTDEKPLNGTNYYRLKMVDKDETFAYSRIRNVDFGQAGAERLVLYPNPVHDQILIQADDISQISQVEVIGVNGQVLYQQTRQKSDVDNKIDVKGFRSGIYVVRLTRSDRSVTSVKMIKD